MKKIGFGGWQNCYQLSNDLIELVITAEVGPRIIYFGLKGKSNVFKTYPKQLGVTESDSWLNFGGHRLWHAPEAFPRTYYPDMEPVLIQEIDGGVLATQKPEPTTGLQNQMEIKLAPDKPEVQIKHVLINHNLWSVETAPWAISVMAAGGVGILALPLRGPHPEFILPTSNLSIWPYTDLSDPRWNFGERYIFLQQDSDATTPQKIGIFSPDGWAGYINNNCFFLKQVPIQYEGMYPDRGVNFEMYTDGDMLELESLGPIETIPPKGMIDHMEHWTLLEGVPTPKNEAAFIETVMPRIESGHD